jgi:hypothetical protein
MLVLAGLCLGGCWGSRPVGTQVPAAAARDPFRDVTREAGITYKLQPAVRPLRIKESVGSGCGFFDYDGVGFKDLLLVGTPRSAH